ncbi:uncharacterized protein BCR38DRAFT_500261 [Pseudomassariella vexata]|uniref:Rhodopsin domain-containing protein n=1 Tax=Pseudomassariella vexata TaxID=1141098 RepID=A0A1Y2DH99_9PEZI|nr:uncharacterized protein BCR38DRAFT_500261 [Pseudomassariella vexata]ORY58496.1 hypothetical protein BCR38DRAFT_500261 [Pseudomassariella vexata]
MPEVYDPRPKVNSGVWCLTIVATLFLGLRIWCRLIRNRGLWWDDYFFIIAWVLLMVTAGLISTMLEKGYGRRLPITTMAKLAYNLSLTFNYLCAGFAKTAFALTLLRIIQGRLRYLIWVIVASVDMFYVISAIVIWAPICNEMGLVLPGRCWAPITVPMLAMACGSYSALLDVVLAFVPCKLVWRTQMKKKERLGVLIAMSLGVFLTGYSLNHGFPDAIAGSFLPAQGEPAVTIIAASIPVLRVLVRDLHKQQPTRSCPNVPVRTSRRSTNINKAASWSKTSEEGLVDLPAFRSEARGIELRDSNKNHVPNGIILQTVHVDVQYHSNPLDRSGRNVN